MPNATIKIGVIGAGWNTTRMHIPGFQAIDGVEVAGVVNRSNESSQRVADQFGIPRVYDSWRDLVSDPDVDAVCIGTWPYLHKATVLASLDQDKHVLTEARMAMDAKQAKEMLAASLRKPHLIAQIVPADFTFQADRTIAGLIADGYLGDLVSVDMVVQQGFVNEDGPFTWRQDRDLSGYNIMLMGAMFEGLMRWVGPATEVAAVTTTTVPTRRDETGEIRFVTVPDHVEVLAEMAAGPLLHMRVSEVTGLGPRSEAWIFGTDGTLHLEFPMSPKDGEPAKLYGGRRGDSELSGITLQPEKQDRWRVEEEFIGAVRGEEQVRLTTFADGVRYMEFTEAVTRSAQERETVSLPM